MIAFVPKRLHGIALFIVAMIFFSAMNVTIRSLAGEMHPLQMVFIRNGLSFSMLIPFILIRQPLMELRTTRFKAHFMRAFIGLIAMESWFYALSHTPVNTATALSFSAPLFSTILAVCLLGERIGIRRVMALLIGFMGVLIIINPFGEASLSPFVLIVLFSAFMMASTGIIIKRLTSSEPSWRIVMYMTIIMSLLSLPPALTVWQEVTMEQLGALALIALFSTIAQMSLTQAIHSDDLVTLMPFEFTRLVFTALFAWIAFAEAISLNTITGSSIIIASAVFIAWRESEQDSSAATISSAPKDASS